MTTTDRPKGYVTGRPTLYREEYCNLMLELIGDQGYSVIRFCAHLSIAKDTFYNWLTLFKEFSDAYEIAKVKLEAYWEFNLINMQQGEKVNSSLVKFHMVNRFGWTDRQEQKVTATVTTHEGSLKELE